jgi:hypothetical protein
MGEGTGGKGVVKLSDEMFPRLCLHDRDFPLDGVVRTLVPVMCESAVRPLSRTPDSCGMAVGRARRRERVEEAPSHPLVTRISQPRSSVMMITSSCVGSTPPTPELLVLAPIATQALLLTRYSLSNRAIAFAAGALGRCCCS